MTAREWLDQHFGGSNEEFSPMNGYSASKAFFVTVFGAAVQAALAGGTSTYDAVMGVPGGTRGWELYFNDWKQRGILM